MGVTYRAAGTAIDSHSWQRAVQRVLASCWGTAMRRLFVCVCLQITLDTWIISIRYLLVTITCTKFVLPVVPFVL